MSQDISAIRRALVRVPSDLKLGNFIAAARNLRGAASAMIRIPMMKAEQEEFARLIDEGASHMAYNKEISRLFPLAISYTQGFEQVLVDTLDELIAALEAKAGEEGREALRLLEEKKRASLQKGKDELDRGEHDEARSTFNALTKEFEGDGELASTVGDVFLQAGLFEDALRHFEHASGVMPESAAVYNRIGISFRKLGRHNKSRENFEKALTLEPGDPNLHFNLGRLYLDMQDWNACLDSAETALKLDPAFAEAAKLAAYCKKKLG